MAVDAERSIHVLSPFDGLTEVGFVRSTPLSPAGHQGLY
jgi:hypothetical protein